MLEDRYHHCHGRCDGGDGEYEDFGDDFDYVVMVVFESAKKPFPPSDHNCDRIQSER